MKHSTALTRSARLAIAGAYSLVFPDALRAEPTAEDVHRLALRARELVEARKVSAVADVVAGALRPDGARRRARLLAVLILIEQVAHALPDLPLAVEPPEDTPEAHGERRGGTW